MSISLNSLFYGDETTNVLEKGCTFCNEKQQCRLAYTVFSKQCKKFDHVEINELTETFGKANING